LHAEFYGRSQWDGCIAAEKPIAKAMIHGFRIDQEIGRQANHERFSQMEQRIGVADDHPPECHND